MSNKHIDQELIGRIMRDTLKPKHATDPDIIRFIEQYLLCHHPEQAARAAGLSAADGRWLFKQSDIYNCIQKITQEGIAKFGFDAEQTVARVREVGELDMVGAIKPDGTFIENLHEWPPEIRRGIKKIKMKNYFEEDHNGVPQYRGKVLEVEFHDKMKGLKMMADEKGVMKRTTVVEHDVGKNARSFLLESVRRAEAAVSEIRPAEAIDVTPLSVPAPAPFQFTFKKPGGG